jgi:hypothetical protein
MSILSVEKAISQIVALDFEFQVKYSKFQLQHTALLFFLSFFLSFFLPSFLPFTILIWHTVVFLFFNFILFIYIPWIVRDKPHLDIGIVNIDMNTATQKCTYNMNTTRL